MTCKAIEKRLGSGLRFSSSVGKCGTYASCSVTYDDRVLLTLQMGEARELVKALGESGMVDMEKIIGELK